jgi:hypothetical protein
MKPSLGSQTDSLEVIEALEKRQLLRVKEIGDFWIEWHLSANLNTIKCMYGLKHGANCNTTFWAIAG